MATYNFNVVVKDQTETAVSGATVTVYKDDGTVAGTGTTNASGVLAAAIVLDTTYNTHNISVSKTGYTTYSAYYVAYQNDTSYYVRLPSYSTNYTTVAKVTAFMGLPSTEFSTTSTPTDSAISDMILRNEGEIDAMLMSSWKSNTVTEEFHDLKSTMENTDGFVRIFPKYRPLRTKDSDFKIENWAGSSYTDFVTGKTEGRDSDYYFDYNKGCLYLKPVAYGDQYLRLTYKWGYSSVPLEIEKLCTLKTALNLVDLDDFAGKLRVGDQQLSTKRDSYLQQIKALEANLRKIRF
jgi:hypothetical protein